MATCDLIPKVTAYVRTYMAKYDPSHDYEHIRRVVRLAQKLHAAESAAEAPLDPVVVHLAALLHDVGDKKYVRDGEDPNTMVRDALLQFGADQEFAVRVQAICSGVSYSCEVADPARVRRLIEQYPEREYARALSHSLTLSLSLSYIHIRAYALLSYPNRHTSSAHVSPKTRSQLTHSP